MFSKSASSIRLLMWGFSDSQMESIPAEIHKATILVAGVNNRDEAMEYTKRQSPDITLLVLNSDAHEPFSFLAKLREMDRQAVMVGILSEADFSLQRKAFHAGVSQVLLVSEMPDKLGFVLEKAWVKRQELKQQEARKQELESAADERAEILNIQKEALEREQQRTRGIIDEAYLGFLVLDGDSEEVFLINKRGQDLLSLPEVFRDHYLLRNYRELFPDQIVSLLTRLLVKVREQRGVLDCGNFELAEQITGHVVAYPLMVGDAVSSVVFAVEDISERTLLEKQVIQSARLADIGELAAAVGHEINNPVAFVTSNMHTLKKYVSRIEDFLGKLNAVDSFLGDLKIDEEKILDVYQGVLSLNDEIAAQRKALIQMKGDLKIDQTLEDVQTIILENLDGLDRVTRIVKDLKTFSYMGEEQPEEADLNKVMEDTLSLVHNQLKYKAEVIKHYGSLPLLRCYARQISQVFSNLLINAAHSIESQGEITIRTCYEEQAVKVSVKDTGCGMDSKTLEHIFDPFFTTKSIGKGTGLGLSVSYRILDKHQAKVQVESEIGSGTQFAISFPLDGLDQQKGNL